MGKWYNDTDQRGLLHLPKNNTVVLCVFKMLRVTELQNSYRVCSQLHGTSNGTYHFQHIPAYPLYFKNDIFTTALLIFIEDSQMDLFTKLFPTNVFSVTEFSM